MKHQSESITYTERDGIFFRSRHSRTDRLPHRQIRTNAARILKEASQRDIHHSADRVQAIDTLVFHRSRSSLTSRNIDRRACKSKRHR